MTTARRGRPTRAEAAQLDQKLRDAAVATFLEQGYDRATMEMIAEAAGITKRTLYARYADKRAVFLDVIPRALSRSVERDPDPAIGDDDGIEAALLAIGRGALKRALDPDTVRLHRIAMNESPRFPEFAVSAGESIPPTLVCRNELFSRVVFTPRGWMKFKNERE